MNEELRTKKLTVYVGRFAVDASCFQQKQLEIYGQAYIQQWTNYSCYDDGNDDIVYYSIQSVSCEIHI